MYNNILLQYSIKKKKEKKISQKPNLVTNNFKEICNNRSIESTNNEKIYNPKAEK